MVTEIAQNSNEEIVSRFSGLGIPVSFQKKIHTDAEANTQITAIEENYKRLCRGENLQVRFFTYANNNCIYSENFFFFLHSCFF